MSKYYYYALVGAFNTQFCGQIMQSIYMLQLQLLVVNNNYFKSQTILLAGCSTLVDKATLWSLYIVVHSHLWSWSWSSLRSDQKLHQPQISKMCQRYHMKGCYALGAQCSVSSTLIYAFITQSIDINSLITNK